MKIDIESLKKHMTGYGVPRHIKRKVLLELYPFCTLTTLQAYQGLDDLKQRLKGIASDETLSTRHRLMIERSYYILSGDQTTLNHQVAKDLEAINEPETDAWMAMWPTFAKGSRDFGKLEGLRLDNIQPIYQSLWTKYSTDGRCNEIKEEQQRIDYAVSKSRKRLDREIQQWSKLPADLKGSPIWEKVFSGIHLLLVPDKGNGDTFVGNVGVAQEKGFKTRLFASPYCMYQCALDPFQRRLQQITASVQQDCHRNQQQGIEWAQNQMLMGKRIYSYDLSKATHRFPWGVQLRLIKHLSAPKPIVDLYTFVSKGSYRFGQETLSWKSGQPLGTDPSFFVFSLAHHALLLGICRDLGINEDCYRILGDDIIIADEKVAIRYKSMMTKMGNVINMAKSHEGKIDIAEFAGGYITPTECIHIGKLGSITRSNEFTVMSGFTNRDNIRGEVRGQMDSIKEFHDFTPLETSVMDPVTHRYIELKLATSVAQNLSIPDTVTLWDFAATVASGHPQHKFDLRQQFYNYYIDKMGTLGKELFSYTKEGEQLITSGDLSSLGAQSEWKSNHPSPASLINNSVKELLLELAECPTQCIHLWARALMRKRGFSEYELEVKSKFAKVSRELIQLATAYKLSKPKAWMTDPNKFAKKLNQWHKAAVKLDKEGKLLTTVLQLEDEEFAMRSDRQSTGSPVGAIVQNSDPAEAISIKPFRFDVEIAIR